MQFGEGVQFQLTNLLPHSQVQEEVLAASQASEGTADRLVSTVEGVASMVATNSSSPQSLHTDNLEITAARSGGNVTTLGVDGTQFTLPDGVGGGKPVFLVRYQSNKVGETTMGSRKRA